MEIVTALQRPTCLADPWALNINKNVKIMVDNFSLKNLFPASEIVVIYLFFILKNGIESQKMGYPLVYMD